ncbi:hypothetical protein LZ640_05390 [Aeromonas media]|uniref:hypothetical protein n=1 Tax=Aeromonas media TaxID=651 RepID=UPI001F3E0D53|nr:hypothetical protein [Aeromonas media]MCE9923923.1 hypothetical protein [Aeromonas media]
MSEDQEKLPKFKDTKLDFSSGSNSYTSTGINLKSPFESSNSQSSHKVHFNTPVLYPLANKGPQVKPSTNDTKSSFHPSDSNRTVDAIGPNPDSLLKDSAYQFATLLSETDKIKKELETLRKRIEQDKLDFDGAIKKDKVEFKGYIDQKKEDILSEVHKDNKETKNSILSSISLFVGFFAFLSINVNIYSKADSISQAVVVLFCSLLCILFFVYGTILLIKKEDVLGMIGKTCTILITVLTLLLSIFNIIYSHNNQKDYLNEKESIFEWIPYSPKK